ENYIKANGHLPEVMSAEAVAAHGYAQSEVNETLLRKIEELTLYSIALEKTNDSQKGTLDNLEAQVSALQASNAELRAMLETLIQAQDQK
ncbi:MAG TPA: hypothetical protein DCR93_15165, partial [Cytophagales bacterium]|nr:hypothetical protein [Cytophagales bacterium]